MKKAFGLVAILATFAVVGVTASVALAVPLSNPQEAENCTTATGTWHFVHVQTSATSGTLTAVIGGTTFTVGSEDSPSNNLHYNITAGGTLDSASDDVSDGKLVLSDCPTAPPPPPPPPPPPV
jgi:type II secretory pathway pseudopilin PulG